MINRLTNKSKVIIGIVLLLVVIILITMLNPMRQSEENIRERLLKEMPVGTSMEDVIRVIESKRTWELKGVSNEFGYYVEYGYPSGAPKGGIVGVKSIDAVIGKYNTYFLIGTYVEAFWGFDGSGRLIEIDVRKTYDVP